MKKGRLRASSELATEGIYVIQAVNGAPLPLNSATFLTAGSNNCAVDIVDGFASFDDNGTYTFQLSTTMRCQTGTAPGTMTATGTFVQQGHDIVLEPGLARDVQLGDASITDGVLRIEMRLPNNDEAIDLIMRLLN